MSDIEWKDATSYSQGQRGKIDPNAWECTVKGVRVWVGSGHRHYPDEWVMHCPELGMDAARVGPTSALTANDAKQAALTQAAREASRKVSRLIDFAAACQEPAP